MALKSVSIDFEHRCITYRHDDRTEERISVEQISPSIYQAEMKIAELPEKTVDSLISQRLDEINKNEILTADQKVQMAENLQNTKNVERIRRELLIGQSKRKAREIAEKEVDAMLKHFEKSLAQKGFI